MLRFIFYLIFLIILSYGISNFGKDKAKDEPEKPIGDHFIDKMKTMNENCSEDMEQVIGFFRMYGHFSAQSGDFEFNYCKNCNQHMLGHEKEEEECQEDRIDDEEVKRREELLRQNDKFNEYLEQFKRVWCRECDKTFANRIEREEHDKSTHSRENILVEKDLDRSFDKKMKIVCVWF